MTAHFRGTVHFKTSLDLCIVRPKPKSDKNDLLQDWTVVRTAFSGLFPDEFKNEYLIEFFYFSSNSCQFLKYSDLSKTAECPLGNFICIRDDLIIDTNQTVDFYTAESFCSGQSYELSKFVSVPYNI